MLHTMRGWWPLGADADGTTSEKQFGGGERKEKGGCFRLRTCDLSIERHCSELSDRLEVDPRTVESQIQLSLSGTLQPTCLTFGLNRRRISTGTSTRSVE